MEIVLNGTVHPLGEVQSIAELVAQLDLTHKAIAVAVNRSVITRQKWDEYRLQDHDQVDVVRAIGGG